MLPKTAGRTRQMRIQILKLATICSLIVQQAGCGLNDQRATVEGTVSFQGRPLPEGAVMLFPIDGTAGRGGNTEVKDGQYQISEEQLLYSGKYSVSVMAVRGTGRKVPVPDMPGVMEEVMEQYIPKQYSSESTLTIELQPGTNVSDFDLQ